MAAMAAVVDAPPDSPLIRNHDMMPDPTDVTAPSLGERLSISLAVAAVWLFGGVFVALFLVFYAAGAESPQSLFLLVAGLYVCLGLFAVGYVYFNPRRPTGEHSAAKL